MKTGSRTAMTPTHTSASVWCSSPLHTNSTNGPAEKEVDLPEESLSLTVAGQHLNAQAGNTGRQSAHKGEMSDTFLAVVQLYALKEHTFRGCGFNRVTF